MATIGQFYWPSVGTFVAAYGQFFMAANRHTLRFRPRAGNHTEPTPPEARRSRLAIEE